jgi:flagellar hook-length control protein FliK
VKIDGIPDTPPAQAGAAEPAEKGGAGFREALDRVQERDAGGAKREGSAQREPDKEKGKAGVPGGDEVPLVRSERPSRGLARAATEAEGEVLPSFHVPPPILQAPPPIVRPAVERSPVVDAAQAIADRVVQAVRLEAHPSGRMEFVLEMRPEVLGGAEVRVRVEAGRVHALFAVQQPEVRATLEAQAHLLRSALEERGLEVGEVAVTLRPARHGARGDDSGAPDRDRDEGSGGGSGRGRR